MSSGAGNAPWEQRQGSAPTKRASKGQGPSQNERRRDLVRGMMLPQPKGAFSPPQPEDDPDTPLVYAIARAGDDRRAQAIRAIRVSALTPSTSFFVTMTGKSTTQVQAISNNVRTDVEEQFGLDALPQGDPRSGWVVLDFGDVMVHIFTREQKEFYDLESLWRNGQHLPLDKVVSPEGLMEPTEEGTSGLEAEEAIDQIWDDDDADIWG